MTTNWYVIQTKPKKEKEAESYLAPKGVEIFSPLLETFSYAGGAMRETVKPLFPNYIFGRFDMERNYSLVRWARGVKCVLGYGGYPVPVAEEVIEIIRTRTGPDGIVRRHHRFEARDAIRVTAGPMKDLLGIFERYVSDGERVRILLNLIGYQPAVEVHYSMIEKVA
jgi:transcriptional antiterminator RfaH